MLERAELLGIAGVLLRLLSVNDVTELLYAIATVICAALALTNAVIKIIRRFKK